MSTTGRSTAGRTPCRCAPAASGRCRRRSWTACRSIASTGRVRNRPRTSPVGAAVPIRTPHGRGAAYRSIWAWPLRSPLRLTITTVVVVAVVVGGTFAITALSTGRAGGGPALDGGTATSAGRRPDAAPGRTPTPTVLPPVPELTPSQLPLSAAPDEAVEVAARWAAAWVRPRAGTTAQEWLDGLRNTTTEEYLG